MSDELIKIIVLQGLYWFAMLIFPFVIAPRIYAARQEAHSQRAYSSDKCCEYDECNCEYDECNLQQRYFFIMK